MLAETNTECRTNHKTIGGGGSVSGRDVVKNCKKTRSFYSRRRMRNARPHRCRSIVIALREIWRHNSTSHPVAAVETKQFLLERTFSGDSKKSYSSQTRFWVCFFFVAVIFTYGVQIGRRKLHRKRELRAATSNRCDRRWWWAKIIICSKQYLHALRRLSRVVVLTNSNITIIVVVLKVNLKNYMTCSIISLWNPNTMYSFTQYAVILRKWIDY